MFSCEWCHIFTITVTVCGDKKVAHNGEYSEPITIQETSSERLEIKAKYGGKMKGNTNIYCGASVILSAF